VSLAGKTIVMSGGSRGIGLAIALRAASDGANLVLIAKTDNPDPRLQGTIHTAAEAIEQAGGKALKVIGDVRNDEVLESAVAQAVQTFGGIDATVNNASVINLAKTIDVEPKRYDLMMNVNSRGTFMLSRYCLPELIKSAEAGRNPHILTLSPPFNWTKPWLAKHPAYTVAKYSMTVATLGFAAELEEIGVAANCLWPKTIIGTDAVKNLYGGEESVAKSRKPEIMADAAHEVLTSVSRECTGNTFLDEDVLRQTGVSDFSSYLWPGGSEENLELDIYVDPS
jgi:citronellol/citronellal dehydrogenase